MDTTLLALRSHVEGIAVCYSSVITADGRPLPDDSTSRFVWATNDLAPWSEIDQRTVQDTVLLMLRVDGCDTSSQ